MNTAWIMALGAGAANAGVALGGEAAERSRCHAAPYSMVAFAVAGLTAQPVRTRSTGW